MDHGDKLANICGALARVIYGPECTPLLPFLPSAAAAILLLLVGLNKHMKPNPK